MQQHKYAKEVTCAYLYPITRYGYPPAIEQTKTHIAEMTAMGFRSVELEGIGPFNIQYLYNHREEIRNYLTAYNCNLPVLCVVLPQLSSADASLRRQSLEWFEMGCFTARYLGADAVLDNGPLLPLEQKEGSPIQRHYNHTQLTTLALPSGFAWENFWDGLVETYQQACRIAASHGLDFHLHPCEGSLITGTDSFLHFSRAVDAANLLFNLDTANQFYFRENLPLSVLRLAGKVKYIHISDNRGHKVEHLAPGDGTIQWDLFFAALKQVNFTGTFGIDIGGAESDVADLTAAYHRCAEWLEGQLEFYSLKK